MRVAEHGALQQLHVLAQLRGGEEPAAGVVQVHVAALVEALVLGAAKLLEQRRLGVDRGLRDGHVVASNSGSA